MTTFTFHMKYTSKSIANSSTAFNSSLSASSCFNVVTKVKGVSASEAGSYKMRWKILLCLSHRKQCHMVRISMAETNYKFSQVCISTCGSCISSCFAVGSKFSISYLYGCARRSSDPAHSLALAMSALKLLGLASLS